MPDNIFFCHCCCSLLPFDNNFRSHVRWHFSCRFIKLPSRAHIQSNAIKYFNSIEWKCTVCEFKTYSVEISQLFIHAMNLIFCFYIHSFVICFLSIFEDSSFFVRLAHCMQSQNQTLTKSADWWFGWDTSGFKKNVMFVFNQTR